MQLNKHPILLDYYNFVQKVEELPADVDQTAIVVKLGEVGNMLEKFVDKFQSKFEADKKKYLAGIRYCIEYLNRQDSHIDVSCVDLKLEKSESPVRYHIGYDYKKDTLYYKIYYNSDVLKPIYTENPKNIDYYSAYYTYWLDMMLHFYAHKRSKEDHEALIKKYKAEGLTLVGEAMREATENG